MEYYGFVGRSNAALEFGDKLYFIYTSKAYKAKGQNHIFFDL